MNEQEIRALLAKHGNLNFVKRILNKNAPSIDNGDGSRSSHKMETSEYKGKNWAYPTIIQGPDGKLKDLSKEGKDAAWEYALKTGEMIPFDKADQAEEFAKHEGSDYNKIWNPDMSQQEFLDKKKELFARIGSMPPAEAAAEFAKLQAENPNPTPNDFQEFVTAFPSLAPNMAHLAQLQQAGALQGKVATGLQVLSDLGMTAASLNQMTIGNRASEQLRQPGLAPIQTPNPLLKQSIYDAQRGIMDQSAILNPVKQGIQEGYLAGQQTNQMASGGQAGANAAYNQALNLQRMQANLGLAPIAQQAQMGNAGVLNDRLGMQIGEASTIQGQQAHNADAAYNQYWNKASLAGQVGAAGRQNLLDATQRLAYHLGNYPVTGMQTPPPASSSYIPPADTIENELAGASIAAPDTFKTPGFSPDMNKFMQEAYANHTIRNSRLGQPPMRLPYYKGHGFNQQY